MVGVSHDTRTPLTAVKLLASAIADDLVDRTTQQRYAEEILGHVDRFSALLDEVFEFSRLEAGDVEWTMDSLAFDELVQHAVQGVQAKARRPDAWRSSWSCPQTPRSGAARASASACSSTSWRAPSATRRGRDHPRCGDGDVQLRGGRGRRHGVGIRPADRDRIFEPFFQGGPDPSRSRPGAGLGVSIFRLIVEAHGGRIWLDDAERRDAHPLQPAAVTRAGRRRRTRA